MVNPLPSDSNLSTNNDRNGGDTPLEGGDIIFPDSKIPPPADPKIHAHFQKSGDIGGIFRTYLKNARETISRDSSTENYRSLVFSVDYKATTM